NLCWDIKRFNANAHCIDVEITECVLFVNDETAICAALERLHQTGARIALDDFGTGYASLSHLVQLDCDEVKLDRSFVRECTTNAANRAVLEAIINIAAKRGKSTVVEGIEDAEQHALLSSLGCTLGQGYWYAKPMSAQNATSYLHQVTSLAVSDEALRQSANQSRGAPSYS
ncbi:MAG: EAL domain-containing protein, partial [Gammaproteobacteria bacterium]|nr:EAL domain-containing protein [Gammaproteobacteria bacterium]